jgi:hypothetical protein
LQGKKLSPWFALHWGIVEFDTSPAVALVSIGEAENGRTIVNDNVAVDLFFFFVGAVVLVCSDEKRITGEARADALPTSP